MRIDNANQVQLKSDVQAINNNTTNETLKERHAVEKTHEYKSTDDLTQIVDSLNKGKVKTEILMDVPYLNQSEDFPTGCEITSATMLLQFYGYDYSIDKVIDEFLQTSEIKVDDNGQITADSPYLSFVGDPRSEESYGCFAPVIKKTLEKATSNKHKILDLTGMNIDEICSTFINNNIPVLVWETIDMVPSYPSETWKLKDGSGYFTWTAEEHCMVLVGYDEDYYYFNDPYGNNGVVKYTKEEAKERFEELKKQAVAMIPSDYQVSKCLVEQH